MVIKYGFKDKCVVISGGTSGIGLKTAEKLGYEGANVFVLGRDQNKGLNAIAKIQNARYIHCDVAKEESCKEAVKRILSFNDKIDILINSAGIYQEERLENLTEDSFDKVMNINVRGTLMLSKACLPHMIGSDANIVNLGSDAGVQGNCGCVSYCASKGAIVSITKALALDYANRVRVNCVCPADVDTPLVKKQLEEGNYTLLDMAKEYPIGRIGKDEEIAHVILSICSPANTFMTGAIINVDGGLTAK